MKYEKQLEIYKEFYIKIKRMARNSGRTNVIMISEIDEEIVATGNKIFKYDKEVKNETNKN